VDLVNYKNILQSKQDILLRIKVIPSAGKTEVVGILEDETIKIALKAAPEKGKANAELIKFLSKEFDVNRDCIKMISGQTGRVKLLRIFSS